MNRGRALFRFDRRLTVSHPGISEIAGVDEAGRGPLAGPVVAAAVMFRRPILLPDLNDSKKLSFSIRESLFREIAAHAHVGIGRVSESVIDEINILQATRLAMREAVLALPRTPGVILIDGTIQLDLPLPQKAIVGGDGRSAAIAAASVVAKVFRDYWMRGLDRLYPGYAFEAHKGYPTPEHLRILGTRGASPVHRRTFRPVRDSLDAVQR